MVARPSAAHADERAECAHAYEQAQRLQQSGERRKAYDAAERCAQSTCPSLLADECKPWVTQLEKQLSRIEVRVTGARTAVPPTTMPSRSIASSTSPPGEHLVDPGVHEVRVVEPETNRVADKTINATLGQLHIVELGFAVPGAVCARSPVATASHAPIPKLAVGLGIAGGALLLTGVFVLGVVGAVKRSDLDECKPDCTSEQIDGVRPFFVAGDVIGAVGLVGLGAAAVVFFATRGDARANASASSRGFQLRF